MNGSCLKKKINLGAYKFELLAAKTNHKNNTQINLQLITSSIGLSLIFFFYK